MSAFDDIVAAVVAKLQEVPAVSGFIERARTRPVPESESTAVIVYFDGATPNPGAIATAPVDWTSRIVLQLYAKSTATAGDEAVDTLLAAVFARLAGDFTLGGLVDDIGLPTIDPVYDANGQKTGMCQLTYPVQHRTDNNTIA